MATSEICSLVLKLTVYPKDIFVDVKEFVLKADSLLKLDLYTFQYQNKFEFFNSEKERILKKIIDEYVNLFGLVPVDIALAEEGIVVRKQEKQLQPLFQNIIYANKPISLKMLVLSRMIKGSLKVFYECDKKRQEEDNYQSFFDGKLKYVAKRLATGSVKNTDYEYVFNDILLKKRCPQVLRFLLNDFNKLEMDSIYDVFLSSVDDFDNPRFLHERAPEENPKGYYYRYPYRND